MIDVVEILQHWHAGRPKAVIAESLGVDRRTVRKYVEAVEAHGLSPGGPALSREEWSELVRQLFPSLVDARARMLTFPAIDAFRDEIGVGAEEGVDVSADALAGRYSWCHGCRSFRESEALRRNLRPLHFSTRDGTPPCNVIVPLSVQEDGEVPTHESARVGLPALSAGKVLSSEFAVGT